MFKKLAYLPCMMLVLCLIAGVSMGGLAYPDPVDGWTYVYTGDLGAGGADFTALDGTWDHDNSGDAWDELEIGAGAPGGVSVLTEGDVIYLRLQDTGDPRDYGITDPSNRKIYFCHSITNDIGDDVAATLLDDGVTMTFRARVPTTGPLDDAHPAGGTSAIPWPVAGDGYVGHHTGKDIFGIHQSGDTSKISFALSVASDSDFLEGKQGLTMNSLDSTTPSAVVDIEDGDGTLNILELDPTVWHEFWVVIEKDITETGTHMVTIYVDGDISSPGVFYVTAGTGDNEYDDSYFALGVGSTSQQGAVDVDFFAYKEGTVYPPGARVKAQRPEPLNGALIEEHTISLSWIAGENAVSHDVYFGENFEDVNNGSALIGNQTETSYGPLSLDFGKTYYWRIDEINDADPNSPWTGEVWSFTTANYIVVDDIEDYNDWEPDTVYFAWIDGYNVATNGSTIGYPQPIFSDGEHFVETDVVHGGLQSMPFFYDNATTPRSEATKNLTSPTDWTQNGVVTLRLWHIAGQEDNAPEPMYVTLNNSFTILNDDASAAQANEWSEWVIDLQDFSDQGANLASINFMTIGFGDGLPGGAGLVFFDDIRLYRPESESEPEPTP